MVYQLSPEQRHVLEPDKAAIDMTLVNESPNHLAGLTFPFAELLDATGLKCKDNILEEGGYGVVYVQGIKAHYYCY